MNREDWRFEVVVVDDNSSIWTGPEISTFTSNNFSIWWVSPFLEEPVDSTPSVKDSKSHENRALFWGILGVIFGAIVAAGVMFRGFEKRVLGDVPPPFREEE